MRGFQNLVIQLTEFLLLMASEEVSSKPSKWQKYKERPQIEGESLTIAQTRKSCQTLFLGFEKTLFLPKISKNGKGRTKGTKFAKKAYYKPVKSKKSSKKINEKSQINT